jgi:hypothetical protein
MGDWLHREPRGSAVGHNPLRGGCLEGYSRASPMSIMMLNSTVSNLTFLLASLGGSTPDVVIRPVIRGSTISTWISHDVPAVDTSLLNPPILTLLVILVIIMYSYLAGGVGPCQPRQFEHNATPSICFVFMFFVHFVQALAIDTAPLIELVHRHDIRINPVNIYNFGLTEMDEATLHILPLSALNGGVQGYNFLFTSGETLRKNRYLEYLFGLWEESRRIVVREGTEATPTNIMEEMLGAEWNPRARDRRGHFIYKTYENEKSGYTWHTPQSYKNLISSLLDHGFRHRYPLVTIEIPENHHYFVIDGGHRIAAVHLLTDMGLLTGNFSILSFPHFASTPRPTTGPNHFSSYLEFVRDL